MDGLVLNAIELTVPDRDVVDGIGQVLILVAYNHHTVLRLLACHVLHRHVAYSGIETTTADLLGFIVGIDFQYGLLTLAHGDVAHVDVLNHATTTRIGLDAQHTVQIRRVHLTVLSIDVLTASADLRADDHTTVTVLHLTVADDDVLRGTSGKAALTTLATIVIASALDGDTVVAGIEITVLYQHTVAALWVAAVTIGAVIINMYATYGNVRRQQRMDNPEGRTQQGDVLNENALTLVEVNHLRTQTVLRTKTALVHINAILGTLQ